MRVKGFGIFNQGEEGAILQVRQFVNENGFIRFPTLSVRSKTNYKGGKDKIRALDKTWVYHNIPSSIWWYTEVHHDWENGGIMFLISKEKHKEITKKEVRKRKNGKTKENSRGRDRSPGGENGI